MPDIKCGWRACADNKQGMCLSDNVELAFINTEGSDWSFVEELCEGIDEDDLQDGLLYCKSFKWIRGGEIYNG